MVLQKSIKKYKELQSSKTSTKGLIQMGGGEVDGCRNQVDGCRNQANWGGEVDGLAIFTKDGRVLRVCNFIKFDNKSY